MPSLKKSILLCGFMGCGKTTVGKLAAQEWNVPFYDTDALIEKRAGKTIPLIFQEGGETLFRDMEYEVTRILPSLPTGVISSGGGLMTFERNAHALSGQCTIIYLDRDFHLLWEVLSKATGRPLLIGKSREDIFELYQARSRIYREHCDCVIQNNESPIDCVRRIGQVTFV